MFGTVPRDPGSRDTVPYLETLPFSYCMLVYVIIKITVGNYMEAAILLYSRIYP